MLKFLFFNMIIVCNSFLLNVKYNLYKPVPKIHNIKMTNVPSYDPSIVINKLAKSSNEIDKYNLKDFLSSFL